MSKIDDIRELHCYKKMYHLMQNAVINCVDICKDPVIKNKLIKAQQDAEDIYTGEIYENKTLNADERIIVALLNLLMDTEIDRVTEPDMDFVDYCVEWSLAIQNKKVELSEEFVSEQVNKILSMANIKKDSEQ